MKTLRESIDQLDEISRRDFLRGAGAAAGAAALGYGANKLINDPSKKWDKTNQDYDELDKEYKRKELSLTSTDGKTGLTVEPDRQIYNVYLFIKDNSIWLNAFSQLRMKIDNNPAETIENIRGGAPGFHFTYPVNKIINADKILFQVAFINRGETGREPTKEDYKIVSFIPGQKMESTQEASLSESIDLAMNQLKELLK